MGIFELLLLSIGLGMDAFAVSVCKGISMKKMDWKKACIVGLYFGGFQALMPVIGYFLGTSFQFIITNIDHWVAFVLLGIIGGKMIQEAFQKDKDEEEYSSDVSVKTMLILSVATSIDALKFFFKTVKSLSRPAKNMSKITPISDITSKTCPL